jgi:hypothetical protein
VNGSVLDLLGDVLVVSVLAATPLEEVVGVVVVASSLDGEVPLFDVVVGVVGVVLGGVVVVVVVVVVVPYPESPSLAARAAVGATRPALTMSASGSTENLRAIRERLASPPIPTDPRGLLEATTSFRVMPTSVSVRVRLGPESRASALASTDSSRSGRSGRCARMVTATTVFPLLSLGPVGKSALVGTTPYRCVRERA